MAERIVESFGSTMSVGTIELPLYLILLIGIVASLLAAGIYMLIFYVYVGRYDKYAEAHPHRAAFAVLALTWILIVLGLTCSRDPKYEEPFGRFLESYFAAWSSASASLWQNIALNVILFIPFGFFVSGTHKKLNFAPAVCFISALLSFAVEVYQYYSMTGYAEFDDIIDNTMGGLIGWGLYYILSSAAHHRKDHLARRIFVGLLPGLVCAGVSFTILLAYWMKPYGNFATSVLYPQKTYSMYISWEVPDTQMEDPDSLESAIYKNHIGTKDEAFSLANDYFSFFGTTADDWSLETDGDSVTVSSDDEQYTMVISLNGMTYKFFPATSDAEFSKQSSSTVSMSEDKIEGYLNAYGCTIPDGSKFRDNEDGSYTFTIYSTDEDGTLHSGKLTAYFGGDAKEGVEFLGFDNEVIEGKEVGTEEILTPTQIRLLVRNGYFQIPDWNQRTNPISKITISKLSVTHGVDSKGYIRDVYVLRAKINDEKEHYYITIPAAASANNKTVVKQDV